MRTTFALAFMLVFGCGQDGAKPPTDAAQQTYLLQHAQQPGDVMVSTSDTLNERTQASVRNGQPVTQVFETTSRGVHRLEVLAVGPDGAITRARESWPVQRSTTVIRRVDEGTGDPPTESIDDKESAVVVSERRNGSWHHTLEAGDPASKAIGSLLTRENPHVQLFLPNRRVAIGESWTPEKSRFADVLSNVPLESATVSTSAKAVGLEDYQGVACVKVVYEVTISGPMRDQNVVSKATETRLNGWLLFDPVARHTRAWAWSLATEFEADSRGDDGEPITVSVRVAGSTSTRVEVTRSSE